MLIRRILPVAALCLTLLPAVAFAQQDADARLNRLENEIQTLSRAVFRDEMPTSEKMQDMSGAGGANQAGQAGLDLRISQLEMELATLTGKFEQQNFELRQMQERIEKTLADFDLRLTEVESRGRGLPTATAQPRPVMQGFDTRLQATPSQEIPVAMPDAPAAPTPAGQLGSLNQSPDGEFSAAGNTAADVYEQAFALLRDKNYDAAEKSFTDFLTRYPGHDLAANAKYWLGETFYVRGNFERAARVFAEAYQLYPKGPKGPDNLLKLSLSLNGMGKKDDACLALTQLKQEYSAGAGAAPVLARADREWTNMGCK